MHNYHAQANHKMMKGISQVLEYEVEYSNKTVTLIEQSKRYAVQLTIVINY